MHNLDIAVVVVYFAGVLGVGAWFARRQGGATDYFLGKRDLPWWAVMLSIVATETSAITVISIPGLGAQTNLAFLQLPLGYIVGRIGVALWLLPGYFKGEQETAYARLESRFGPYTRRAASGIFLVVRSLADSVRVYATAIPLAVFLGWSIPLSVAVLGVVTVIYAWAGGLKAVVWVDVVQLFVYLLGGTAALYIAIWMAGGTEVFWAHAVTGGKLHIFDFSFSFSQTYTFWGGLLGGALLTAASHGTDHLIVQRLLASRGLKDARKALVWSGFVVFAQFTLFLMIGVAIWSSGQVLPGDVGDRIFPNFVVNNLPSPLSGLVIAGILSAAMGTHSSALNSLASAVTHDFYAPLTGRRDEQHLLSVGRWVTLFWAVILAFLSLTFKPGQRVVELALSIASITYGGMLGTYILSGVQRIRGRDAIAALTITTATMLVVVVKKPWPFDHLAFPWFVPMGVGIALVVGFFSSLFGPADGQTVGRSDGQAH